MEAGQALADSREVLHAIRAKRPRPHLDDKVRCTPGRCFYEDTAVARACGSALHVPSATCPQLAQLRDAGHAPSNFSGSFLCISHLHQALAL